MIKFMKSPLGMTLTAASAILLLSPEARKMTRKLAVKGTAAVLGIVDQVKDASSGMRKQLNSVIDEARVENPLPIGTDHTMQSLEEVQEFAFKDSFNVINDEVIRKYDPLHPAE